MECQVHAIQRADFRIALAEFLDDVAGFENWGNLTHRANTMAGSIFVTLRMDDTAEIAHMASVTTSMNAARPGVNTIGSAASPLTAEIRAVSAVPRTQPKSPLMAACIRMTL